MPRRRKRKDLETLYWAAGRYPGQRPTTLAKILGWPPSKVIRMLPDLEAHGLLLYEDHRGGLYTYRKVPK